MEDLQNREESIKKLLRIIQNLWIKHNSVSSWKKKLGNPLRNMLDLLKEIVLVSFQLRTSLSLTQFFLQASRKIKRFSLLSISLRNSEKVILNLSSQSNKPKTTNLHNKLNFGHKSMPLNYQVTVLEMNITLRKWWNGFTTGMMW